MMDKPAPVPELNPVCPPNGTLILRAGGVQGGAGGLGLASAHFRERVSISERDIPTL